MRKTAIFTLVGTAATLLIVNLANIDGANTAGIISEAQAEQVKHMVSPVKAREDHGISDELFAYLGSIAGGPDHWDGPE